MIVYGGEASDSFALISQDGTEEWVIRSNPQVRQRDEHNRFRIPRGCHIAGDAGLVTA